jgi:hypothetical protein
VRIFIGTESGQHRAERVLLWSIEQVRDPSRAYEIHLMKDLVGFDRRRWLTGFTNYRFAIPQLAGGTGRAIYNDVDQIYLVDPAELFDLDMEGHGFLSIRETDTSVMLIDCERMASVWTVDLVRSGKRKSIEARATAVPGLWGPLDPHWNARDEEYVPGRTSVLHFTTIHTQPWHPFPQHFVYQHNPVAEVWHELERGADAAGYRVFGAAHPSRRYGELLERLRVAPDARGDLPPEGLEEVLREVDARTLLDVGLGRPSNATATPGACEDANGRSVTRWDPVYPDLAKPPQESFDAVVCPAALDLVPDEDAGWFVEELFRHARRLVVAGVRREPAPEVLADGSEVRSPPREESWWLARFEEAAARHPDVRWRVVLRRRGALGRERVRTRDGGPPPGRVPRVWVLTDDKAGHTTQSLGLAEAVGWPYEVKELRFRALNRLSNSLLSATRLGLDRRRSSRLEPPWPEVVIATGRRTAPVARWIARQSPGRTRSSWRPRATRRSSTSGSARAWRCWWADRRRATVWMPRRRGAWERRWRPSRARPAAPCWPSRARAPGARPPRRSPKGSAPTPSCTAGGAARRRTPIWPSSAPRMPSWSPATASRCSARRSRRRSRSTSTPSPSGGRACACACASG